MRRIREEKRTAMNRSDEKRQDKSKKNKEKGKKKIQSVTFIALLPRLLLLLLLPADLGG